MKSLSFVVGVVGAVAWLTGLVLAGLFVGLLLVTHETAERLWRNE